MTRIRLLVAAMFLVGACGGSAEPDAPSGEGGGETTPAAEGGGSGSGGAVANPQPPGQGYAMVDGQEYFFDTPGGIDCTVTDEDFAFSYIIGDNQIVMGGGASISGGQWFGSLGLQIYEDDGVTEYAAELVDNPDRVAVDGASVSYSGPMVLYVPAEPGELAEPVSVGDGVFSSTCG